MTSGYELFLFDADDTLFDFQASERHAFFNVLQQFGIHQDQDVIFATYRQQSAHHWSRFEKGEITQAALKVGRFQQTLAFHGLEKKDAQAMSEAYLHTLPDKVVLIEHAKEVCEHLSQRGEVGILTNGIAKVQKRRLESSGLAPFVSFMAISEDSGYAKPDRRFFEYGVKMAKSFLPHKTLMIGDRLETDIVGGHGFGLDTCWFNPRKAKRGEFQAPKFEIHHLSELIR